MIRLDRKKFFSYGFSIVQADTTAIGLSASLRMSAMKQSIVIMTPRVHSQDAI